MINKDSVILKVYNKYRTMRMRRFLTEELFPLILITGITYIISIIYRFLAVLLFYSPFSLSLVFERLYENRYTWGNSKYLSSLIYAPVFETLFFVFFIHILVKNVTSSRAFFVFFSAVFFGLSHFVTGGWYLVFSAMIGGSLFAHYYLVNINRGSVLRAYIHVVLFHSLFNLLQIFQAKVLLNIW
jgi:hypothetical protein